MTKQLVVVVHGVGVREAGVSTDLVTACLHGGNSKSWRAHSSDDFRIPELIAYDQKQLFSTFRAHLQRFRSYGADGTTVKKERVVADFYWGDVSGTGQDLLRVLSGFLRVVLGLSHVVRENARNCYPRATGLDLWLRRLAGTAALVIHGPIVALNLVILAGLLLAWGLGQVAATGWGAVIRDSEALAGWLLGLGSILTGAVMLNRAQVYLLRHLAGWLIWSGLLVLVLCGLGLANSNLTGGWAWRWSDILAVDACSTATQAELCRSDYKGIERLGLCLMSAMMLSWAVVLVCAYLGAVLGLMRGQKPGDPGAVNFVLPAIALMTLLWFITMAAIWYTVMKLPPTLVANRDHVYSALRLVVPAVVGLGLLAMAGGLIHWRKVTVLGKSEPNSYLALRDDLAERYRLIVGRRLLWILRFFLLAVAGFPLFHLAGKPGLSNDAVGWAMAGVGLFAVVLTGAARGAFAMGVGIVADVVVYLNDYSWNSQEPDPATGAPRGTDTRTLTEAIFLLRRKPKPAQVQPPDQAASMGQVAQAKRQSRDVPKGYWLRHRIGQRLDRLVRRLIQQERPDEIVLVSHSQGTVIAMDVLAAEGVAWRKAAGKPITLRLVTMGSPYTHIYNTYFPLSFPTAHQRADLAPVEARGLLNSWVNIFRVDDFVGTHIDRSHKRAKPNSGSGWPNEQPVQTGGHTNYWTDKQVIPKLQKALEF